MKQGEARDVVCRGCGATFTAHGNRACLCPACKRSTQAEEARYRRRQLAAQKRERNWKEEEIIQKARTRAKRANQAIAQVQAQAEQLGLNYGKYVAKLWEESL